MECSFCKKVFLKGSDLIEHNKMAGWCKHLRHLLSLTQKDRDVYYQNIKEKKERMKPYEKIVMDILKTHYSYSAPQ
jgi:hypothetical protein